MIRKHKFTNEEQRQANWCRLYLKVFSKADISTADRHHLTNEAWNLERQPQVWAEIDGPEWGPPSIVDRSTWRRIIKRVFTPCKHLYYLEIPLGKWLYKMECGWEWFVSEDREKLYQHNHQLGQWTQHLKKGRLKSNPKYERKATRIEREPKDIHHTTISMNTEHINIGGTSRIDIMCNEPEEDEEDEGGYRKWLYHWTSILIR